jgi:hypothetical protein
MSRGYGLAFLMLLVAGCSKQPDLMPLSVGRSVTYVVTHGLEKFVEPVKVVAEVPIMGRTGYELSGPMGVSRLVWKDGVLYASQTSNAVFDPPIPLVAVDGKMKRWTGSVHSLEFESDASAELVQKQVKDVQVGTRKVEATLATLTVKMPKGTIELSSWFQPGVGLVQQEQRTGSVLVLRMAMLGGPKEAS